MAANQGQHEILRYQQDESGYFVRGEGVAAASAEEEVLHQQGRDALRFRQQTSARQHRQRRVVHHKLRR